MKSDLPEKLRELAETLIGDDWEHPLTCVETCKSAADEIERLRAIVSVTADGVPVLRGDKIWFPGKDDPLIVGGRDILSINHFMAENDESSAEVSECYSTREAAKENQ